MAAAALSKRVASGNSLDIGDAGSPPLALRLALDARRAAAKKLI